MTVYNFRNNTDFYLVYGGLKYKLDVNPDIVFSQTFQESSVKKKTLHDRNLNFNGAVITKASAGNFSFSIPLLEENDLDAVLALMIQVDSDYNLQPFDFYIVSDTETYNMSTCALEDATFIIERDGILGLSVSGTCSRLYRVGDNTYTVPGTLFTRSATTTFQTHSRMSVSIDSIEQDFIKTITISLKNDIQWLNNDTLHKSLVVTSADNTIYPDSFILAGRTLSGAVEQYITDSTYSKVNTWKENTPITIKIGTLNKWGLQFVIPEAVYTNRLVSASLMYQVYDFRMTYNPSDLSSVILKYNYAGLPV